MVKFYRRTDINTDAATFLDSTALVNYPDLFDGQNSISSISGGAHGNRFLINAPVAPKPIFGDSILQGLEMNVWATDVIAANVFAAPSFDIYKIKGNIGDEGSVAIQAKNGIIGFSHNISDSSPIIYEDFTGSISTKSDETTDLVGGTRILYSGPFLHIDDAVRLESSFFTFKSGATTAQMAERYGTVLEDGTTIVEIKKDYGGLGFGGTNIVYGVWGPVNGKDWQDISEPHWDEPAVKDHVKYKYTTTIEAAPAENIIDPESTIFEKCIYSSSKDSDTSGSGSETGPLLRGQATFSDEKSTVGGTSMKMHCLWHSGEAHDVYGASNFYDTSSHSLEYSKAQTVACSTRLPCPVPVDCSLLGAKHTRTFIPTTTSLATGEYFTLYDSMNEAFVFHLDENDANTAPPSIAGTKDYIRIDTTGSESDQAFLDVVVAEINNVSNYSNLGFCPFKASESSGTITIENQEAGYARATPDASAGTNYNTTACDFTDTIQGRDWWSAASAELSCDVFFSKLSVASDGQNDSAPEDGASGADLIVNDSTKTWWNNVNSGRSFAMTFSTTAPIDGDDFSTFVKRRGRYLGTQFAGFFAVKVRSKTKAGATTYNEKIRIIASKGGGTSRDWWESHSTNSDHLYTGFSGNTPYADDGMRECALDTGKWYKFRFFIHGQNMGAGDRKTYASQSTFATTNKQNLAYIMLIIEDSDKEVLAKIKMPLDEGLTAMYGGRHAGYGTSGNWAHGGVLGSHATRPGFPSWLTFWLNNIRGESAYTPNISSDFTSESEVFIDNIEVKNFAAQKKNFSITNATQTSNGCIIKENKAAGPDIDGNFTHPATEEGNEDLDEVIENNIPTYVSIGFDNLSDFSGAERWLWFSNFLINNENNSNPIVTSPATSTFQTGSVWTGGHLGTGDVAGGIRANVSNVGYNNGLVMNRQSFTPSSALHSSGDRYQKTSYGRGLIVDNNKDAELIPNGSVVKTTNITAVANYNSTVTGTVRVTSAAHNILTGYRVTISDTTNYNGTYTATKIDANSFYITATYVSSQTGSLTYDSLNSVDGFVTKGYMNLFTGDQGTDNATGVALTWRDAFTKRENPLVSTHLKKVEDWGTTTGYSEIEVYEANVFDCDEDTLYRAYVVGGEPDGVTTFNWLGGAAQVQTITISSTNYTNIAGATGNDTVSGEYFYIYDNARRKIGVTFYVSGSDPPHNTEPPEDSGVHEWIFVLKPTGGSDDEEDLATNLQVALNAHAAFTATVSGAVVTVTNTDTRDIPNISDGPSTGGAIDYTTGFTFAVTTEGVDGLVNLAMTNYVDDIKVVEKQGNTIKLNKSLDGLKNFSSMAEAGGTNHDLLSDNIFDDFDGHGEVLTPFILIGPKKYWLTLQIMAKDSSNDVVPKRSYHSVLSLGSRPVDTGVTYNESSFSEGNYARRWDLRPMEKTNIQVDEDYGFGSLDKDNNSGGQVNTFLPFISSSPPTGNARFNTINLSSVIEQDNVVEGDLLAFMIAPSSTDVGHALEIATTEYTTNTNYKPFFSSIFIDELPQSPEDLKVAPNKDNPFYPELTWSCADSDLWYGLLVIDNENINNQYHRGILHFPLNEVGIHGTEASEPTENINNSTTNTTINGALYDIEGLAGYSLRFDGNDDYVLHGGVGDPTSTATTEITVITHIIPDSGGTDDRYIIAQEGTASRKFSLHLNSSNQVVGRVYRTDSDYVELVSSSVIVDDGQTPSCVILTVDTLLKSGNVKLYINGKIEDQSGLALATGTINNWQINATMQSGSGYVVIGNAGVPSDWQARNSAFDGKLEEIVIYKKCYYPVTPLDNKFILNKPISELGDEAEFASSLSYTARLFIKDYHNIRGKLQTEVASSPQVSWRKASFVLDTRA